MLNISNKSINDQVNRASFNSLEFVESKVSKKVLKRVVLVGLLLFIVIMILPWTQNIRSNGTVTTLEIDQRPQNINAVIPGQIENWLVKEGDFVKKGDTIVLISEVKDEYFDPQLVQRTQNQLEIKEQSIVVYADKVKAKSSQINATESRRVLEKEQARNKVKQARYKVSTDSIAELAAYLMFETSKSQYERIDSLYQKGLKSLTELEQREVKFQNAESKKIEATNSLLKSKNELINAEIYLKNIQAKFNSEIAKLESEKLAANTEKLTAEAESNKLQNKVRNYEIRSGFYCITAPQDGYITKTSKNGVGETVKAGENLVSISPSEYQLAVQTFVKPIDLPLLEKGQQVRIQFDGWPAIVFSGWPGATHGTYGGKVYAIDQFISENGKYRVLIQPDEDDYPWPEALRYGGGTSNFMLLNNVPVWYELWRNINDFPPDFYSENSALTKETIKK